MLQIEKRKMMTRLGTVCCGLTAILTLFAETTPAQTQIDDEAAQ
jgi:hypothetical protein